MCVLQDEITIKNESGECFSNSRITPYSERKIEVTQVANSEIIYVSVTV